LLIVTMILLVPCESVFSQDNIGYIEKITGPVYWRSSENAPEIQLKPQDVIRRPLRPGERFRCGPKGRLVIRLYGRRVTIKENMGWFPIPFATKKGADEIKQIEEKGGRTGGRIAKLDKNLTGTYRLDPLHSDDARAAAERATTNISASVRQRTLDALTARLESPDMLAIERRNTYVTIASSRAPQITFVADGREIVERSPDGSIARVRTTLKSDQLTVSSTGAQNNDFTVTFDALEKGRRLRVTRRITAAALSSPVVVQSIYDRTDEVARFNIYQDGPNYQNARSGTAAGGDFLIPNGTLLVATLNENLSTGTTREHDRFTMTVRKPSQYEGAIIEGYVTNVSRSGRVTGRSGMSLNYERIRMRDGRVYRFAGLTEAVRAPDGETVRIDNEGTVEDGDQTNRTAERAAIGTAVGAIIGAIHGGGKGAAIGAVIGAGAGVGSVYVQGRNDLEIASGTELSIRATGPR
jgi:hypothetical protein